MFPLPKERQRALQRLRAQIARDCAGLGRSQLRRRLFAALRIAAVIGDHKPDLLFSPQRRLRRCRPAGDLSAKYGNVLGGRNAKIQKADIPGKGTFYRVRVPAGSKQEATALCAKYKSAGGQCLVAK